MLNTLISSKNHHESVYLKTVLWFPAYKEICAQMAVAALRKTGVKCFHTNISELLQFNWEIPDTVNVYGHCRFKSENYKLYTCDLTSISVYRTNEIN
jgi:hypothetical protein